MVGPYLKPDKKALAEPMENLDDLKVPFRRDLLVTESPTTPSDRSIEKRRLRKHFVLNVIRQKGPLSRADIAKESGLNLPSVSSLVDELISDELVSEEAARQVLRGRRPIPVTLRSDAACVLGIDIGKVSTTSLLVNLGSQTLQSTEQPTPHLSTPEEHAAWAVKVAQDTFARGEMSVPPLCGIGLGLPGLVATAESNAYQADSTDASAATVALVQKKLSEAFGVEVIVDNDARLMVSGIRWFGNEEQMQNFAVLNVGYGLGLGISLNGRLLSGAQGFAGEIGHIPLGRPDVACFCGGTGCLENTASGAAITSMAKERNLSSSDVEELAQMARAGDAAAVELFETFADALGRGVATIINLFNPEAVILTGKVSRASDVYQERMTQTVAKHALPAALARTSIVVGDPETNLSLLGAVAVVLHHIFYSSRVSYEEVI